MIRLFECMGLCVLTAALAGCSALVRTPSEVAAASHRSLPAERMAAPFAPEHLHADLDAFVETLERVHPDPYTRVGRAAFHAAVDSLRDAIDAPLSRRAFWSRLGPLVARLGDAHTALGFPSDELQVYLDAGGAVFPIAVRVVSDGTLVVSRQAGALGVGTPLTAINGVDAREIVRSLRALVSAESAAYRDDRIERSFPYYLWARYDWTGPFVVETACGTETLEGRVREPTAERTGDPVVRALGYEALGEGDALLQVRSFAGSPARYEQRLDSLFSQMRADRIARLAVDLRGNGGGDSRLGMLLLDRLTDRPYRMASRSEWKRSAEYGSYIKRFVAPGVRWMIPWTLVPEVGGYFRTPMGGLYVTEQEEHQPGAVPARFEGAWALLVGPRTFSSAGLVAVAVKDYRLAPVVGEETGGQASGFGEVYPFGLPHTRLRVGISSKRFVRPSGDTRPGGVLPDLVAPTASDAAEDLAREVAFRALREAEVRGAAAADGR